MYSANSSSSTGGGLGSLEGFKVRSASSILLLLGLDDKSVLGLGGSESDSESESIVIGSVLGLACGLNPSVFRFRLGVGGLRIGPNLRVGDASGKGSSSMSSCELSVGFWAELESSLDRFDEGGVTSSLKESEHDVRRSG